MGTIPVPVIGFPISHRHLSCTLRLIIMFPLFRLSEGGCDTRTDSRTRFIKSPCFVSCIGCPCLPVRAEGYVGTVMNRLLSCRPSLQHGQAKKRGKQHHTQKRKYVFFQKPFLLFVSTLHFETAKLTDTPSPPAGSRLTILHKSPPPFLPPDRYSPSEPL